MTLEEYRKALDISYATLAEHLSIDTSHIRRLCNDVKSPGVITAWWIETATSGKVPMESWISKPERRRMTAELASAVKAFQALERTMQDRVRALTAA